MIEVSEVKDGDDLEALAHEIQLAAWDESNGVSGYSAASLSDFLRREDTVFVVGHEFEDDERCLIGIASGRFEIKPYAHRSWLYVDEVDVPADKRRRGAGRALMKALIKLARERGCEYLWLGTEKENEAARALYRALDPDEVAEVKGYTFELRP